MSSRFFAWKLASNILGLFSSKLVSACHRVEGSSRIVVKALSI
jgi:hypothetical protein